jgi:hypothetical protein
LGMSHYGQSWTVLLSSTSGYQSAVSGGDSDDGGGKLRRRQTTTAELPAYCRTCGSAACTFGVEQLAPQGRPPPPPAANINAAVVAVEATRAADTEAELPAHSRTCGAATGTRHSSHLGGGAACTLQDTCGSAAASDGGNDGSRHGGGGGGNRHRERAAAEFPAWLPGADRHSATGSGRSSRLPSPPSPSFTYNNQDNEGGGERRRRRCQRRRLISGQAQRQQRRQHGQDCDDTASWGLVDPTGSTVYPHRCMLPHVTLVAG